MHTLNVAGHFKGRWLGRPMAASLMGGLVWWLVWWLIWCLMAWAQPVWAWGATGHRLVADMAEAQLGPVAQARLRAILATQGHTHLAQVANWADINRTAATAPWHFVNFPRRDCHYQAARDCPDGQCIVAAIEQQTLLFLQADTDAERLLPLQYLTHFMADVHQPLHAGFQDDRGGNGYQLQAFMEGTNLHAFWDTVMIRVLDETPGWQQRLRGSVAPSNGVSVGAAPVGAQAREWAVTAAEESCRVVSSPGFYPGRHIGMDTVTQFAPVLEQRLQQAAARLALLLTALLNRP